MRTFAWIVGAALFCLATCLFVANLREAAADCPDFDAAEWEPDLQTTSDTNGEFGTTSFLIWRFRETPFIGGIEVYENSSANIDYDELQYQPNIFYPTTCQGAVQVSISGKLTSGSTSGSLTSEGWVWDSGNPPPYQQAYHVLTIN